VVWGGTGPLFHFSDTWQLAINTGTTIVIFLMVFLIQRSQNKDSLALQLKLNEIVAALDGASNRLVNIEDLTEAELDVLHGHYARLATMAKQDVDLMQSHSVDEAATRHEMKHGQKNSRRRWEGAPTPSAKPWQSNRMSCCGEPRPSRTATPPSRGFSLRRTRRQRRGPARPPR
jgi:low affinity Fe/Cu permease